jgi:hypothetical protein
MIARNNMCLLNSTRKDFRDFMNTAEKTNKVPKEAEKKIISERERHKGKIDKAENKARATSGKARTKKAGHEAVSDQKSHEYH